MGAASERDPVSLAHLERLRDRTFRRTPARKVRGQRTGLRFVNEVGFCFTLSDFALPAPCLWVACCGRRHPRWPRHTHHDPSIGLAWNLKDILPAKRLVYYGKLIRGKPTLVSLALFPNFFALIRGGKGSGDYILDYRHGRLSRSAVALLDALHEKGPLETPALRRAAGLGASELTRNFERAMAELQRSLWIVKVEEVYEPDFYYRWDLLDNWLEGPVKAADGIGREEAVHGLIGHYLGIAFYSTPRLLASLFSLAPLDVEAAVARLVNEGPVLPDRRISGLPGRWLLHRAATQR